jgi:hypothetical protein
MQKIFFLLSITTLSLSGCKKNSEPMPLPVPDVRTSLLLAHDWKLAAQTLTFYRDGKTEVIDGYSSMVPCSQDDVTKFHADKSITYGEGDISCINSGDRTAPEPGSWTFNDDQTELTIDSYVLHYGSVLQVLDLTEKTLQLRHTYTYRINNRDYTGVEDFTYIAP